MRTIKELVHAKLQEELTLVEMAQSVELSPANFARMFRESTGETPHQFVLRNRIEHAKEMLRAPEPRVLVVAVPAASKLNNILRECSVMCAKSARRNIASTRDYVMPLNDA